MAREAEAAPLRAALGAAPAEPPVWASSLPVRVAVADHAGVDVVLVTNGTDPRTGVDCIGSTAAALATQVALDHARSGLARRPDLVLTVGTAGGWNRAGASIGDVYLAWDRFVCHDRRIDLPGFDALAEPIFPPPTCELTPTLSVVGSGLSRPATASTSRRRTQREFAPRVPR